MQICIDSWIRKCIIMLMIKDIIQKLLDSGLTQTEISHRANVPQSRISEIASGKQSTISYEAGKRLEALAIELNLVKKAA